MMSSMVCLRLWSLWAWWARWWMSISPTLTFIPQAMHTTWVGNFLDWR